MMVCWSDMSRKEVMHVDPYGHNATSRHVPDPSCATCRVLGHTPHQTTLSLRKLAGDTHGVFGKKHQHL